MSKAISYALEHQQAPIAQLAWDGQQLTITCADEGTAAHTQQALALGLRKAACRLRGKPVSESNIAYASNDLGPLERRGCTLTFTPFDQRAAVLAAVQLPGIVYSKEKTTTWQGLVKGERGPKPADQEITQALHAVGLGGLLQHMAAKLSEGRSA